MLKKRDYGRHSEYQYQVRVKVQESETDQEFHVVDEVTYKSEPDSSRLVDNNTVSIIESEVLRDSNGPGSVKNISCDEGHNTEFSDMLKNSDFNWLEFVKLVREKMNHLSQDSLTGTLADFYQKLPLPGMSDSDMKAVEQSHNIFF